MAHPNEELVRSAYGAFARGDIEAVLGSFDAGIVWYEGGDSKVTGAYRGHQEVRGVFEKLMELSGGTFHVDVHDVLANDDHVVALVAVTASQEDRSLQGLPEAHVWHVCANKLTAFWNCPSDQVMIDTFFTL